MTTNAIPWLFDTYISYWMISNRGFLRHNIKSSGTKDNYTVANYTRMRVKMVNSIKLFLYFLNF